MTTADITVAIPTYAREDVLLETLEALLAEGTGVEILVLDQTREHRPATAARLGQLAHQGSIRWMHLPAPSIPVAMNEALQCASRNVVLFLDDDIVPAPGLLAAHAAGYDDARVWAVAGQVLQPGQEPAATEARYRTRGLRAFLDFPFHSQVRAFIENGMAGNLSVRREPALQVGGFDENFVGAAYRFETDFCRRLCRAGGRILFEPAARIRHLRAPSGGVRAHGDHRASPSPAHGIGDYYFVLRHGSGLEAAAYIALRPLREVSTRFHARRPWWIPVKLVGEARAFLGALRLAAQGPRYARAGGPAPS